jgi:hypothetical protein
MLALCVSLAFRPFHILTCVSWDYELNRFLIYYHLHAISVPFSAHFVTEQVRRLRQLVHFHIVCHLHVRALRFLRYYVDAQFVRLVIFCICLCCFICLFFRASILRSLVETLAIILIICSLLIKIKKEVK